MNPPEPTPNEHPSRRYFLLICPEARREAYRTVFASTVHDVEIIATAEEMLTCCVDEPPLALLLDMAVATRSGSRELAAVFQLRMGWPVIRCNLLPGGPLNGLCTDPVQNGALLDMLAAIATDDEAWRPRPGSPRWHRRHLRVEMQCRVRWRPRGESDWRRGNTLDIGAGGVFLVTYEETVADTPIELCLSDLSDEPLEIPGRVVGVRRWEEGRTLPGLSVAFDPKSIPVAFKRALAQSISLADLR